MLNSTSLDDLHPIVALKARRLIEAASATGLQIIVTSTLRDAEAQAKLYALGRTETGPRANPSRPLGVCVTSNNAGESLHEYGCAFDCFPVLAGHALWGAQPLEWRAWCTLRAIADSPKVNLQWGGRSRAEGCLRELWHFHYSAGFTASDLRLGAQLPAVTLGELSRALKRHPKRR